MKDSATLAELLAPYELVRSIGSRPNPVYVTRAAGSGSGRPQLFVAECLPGAAANPAEKGDDFVTRARRVATLASANVPRVRELVVRNSDVVVFGNFIDGAKLSDVWDELPPEIALRVLIDVLSGLGALHNLRDLQLQPMRLAHGEVSPATILLGLDGTARLLHSIARLVPGAKAEAASMAYLAPEVHLGEVYDGSADVFGAGVLLWEGLTGAPLFIGQDAGAIVTCVRAGVSPAPVRESAPWAKGLVDIAAKALSASPGDRWPTAAAMAAEIRKKAGLHLAPAAEASTFAKRLVGARAKARREALESGTAGVQPHARLAPVVLATAVPEPVAVPETKYEPESLTTEVQVRPPFPDVVAPTPVPPRAYGTADATADATNRLNRFPRAEDEGVDVSLSSLATSSTAQPAPVTTTPRAETVASRSRRGRGALLASVGLLGVGALALAGWRVGHRNAERLAPRVEDGPAMASDRPLAAPTAPVAEAAAPVPPLDASELETVTPPTPRPPSHAHKRFGPAKPKPAAGPSPHGKTRPPPPAHSLPSPSRTKPVAKPSGT